MHLLPIFNYRRGTFASSFLHRRCTTAGALRTSVSLRCERGCIVRFASGTVRWWGFARRTKRECNTPKVVHLRCKKEKVKRCVERRRELGSFSMHPVPLFKDQAQSPLVSEACGALFSDWGWSTKNKKAYDPSFR